MRSRLYIGHLSSETSDATVRAWLEMRGLNAKALSVAFDRATGHGFAFVDFEDDRAARHAVDVLYGSPVDGRVPVLETVELSYSPV